MKTSTSSQLKLTTIIFLLALVLNFSSFAAQAQELVSDPQQIFIPTLMRSLPEPALVQGKPVWKALFIVYRNIDVDYVDWDGNPRHLTFTMPEDELQSGLQSFREYASVASDYSNREAVVLTDTVIVERPINSITSLGASGYWLSPNDTQTELDLYAPNGLYDSVLIYWPAVNRATGEEIPSIGWGWATGAASWTNYATYAIAYNAPSYWFGLPPKTGHVWLHEWLHAVCWYYASKGYPMPSQDADGGGSHGYVDSPTTGWETFYRDLMTGMVLDGGVYKGIVPQAWQSGALRGNYYGVFTDYFDKDTLANYSSSGTLAWDSIYQNIQIGSPLPGNNTLYKSVSFAQTTTISGKVLIPDSEIGLHDSVALALKDEKVEYLATLAYGSALDEKNHISIMKNDEWGSLLPMNLTAGWYTVKLKVDYANNTISMKAWKDGQNEPGWQLSESISPGWHPKLIGFRHYGQGAVIDDLIVVEAP